MHSLAGLRSLPRLERLRDRQLAQFLLETGLDAMVAPLQALDAHGVNSQRIRRFPAVAGVY